MTCDVDLSQVPQTRFFQLDVSASEGRPVDSPSINTIAQSGERVWGNVSVAASEGKYLPVCEIDHAAEGFAAVELSGGHPWELELDMRAKSRVVLLLALLAGLGVVWLLIAPNPSAPARQSLAPGQGEPPSQLASKTYPASTQRTGAREDDAGEPEPPAIPPAPEQTSSASTEGVKPEPPAHTPEPLQTSCGGLRLLVVDSDTVPWCGAYVGLTYGGPNAVAELGPRKTTADGTVEFSDLVPGEWLASVQAGAVFRKVPFVVTEGQRAEVRVVVEREGACLSGVVRHRSTGPLAGAYVRLRDRHAADWNLLSTKSDEAGGYRIEVVPVGTYQVTVVYGPALSRQMALCADLEVSEPGNIRRDLLVGRVCLSGIVRDAETQLALPGVTVEMINPTRAVSLMNRAGLYRFYDVPPGRVQLAMGRVGYESIHVSLDELQAAESRESNFELHRSADLHLLVQDEWGEPVSGDLMLSVRGPRDAAASTPYGTSIRTDLEGHTLIRWFRPGIYELAVAAGGKRTPFQQVEIRPGENNVRFELSGVPASVAHGAQKSLSGMITESGTGAPLSGAVVRLMSDRHVQVHADARGSYTLWDAPPGKHVIQFSRHGFGIQSVECVLEPEREHTLNIALAAVIKLHVIDAAGYPVYDRIYLSIKPRSGEQGTRGSLNLDMEEGGYVTLDQVVPGSYQFSFRSSLGGTFTIIEANIDAGENSLEIRLN